MDQCVVQELIWHQSQNISRDFNVQSCHLQLHLAATTVCWETESLFLQLSWTWRRSWCRENLTSLSWDVRLRCWQFWKWHDYLFISAIVYMSQFCPVSSQWSHPIIIIISGIIVAKRPHDIYDRCAGEYRLAGFYVNIDKTVSLSIVLSLSLVYGSFLISREQMHFEVLNSHPIHQTLQDWTNNNNFLLKVYLHLKRCYM